MFDLKFDVIYLSTTVPSLSNLNNRNYSFLNINFVNNTSIIVLGTDNESLGVTSYRSLSDAFESLFIVKLVPKNR